MHGLSDIPFIWGFPIVVDNPEVERESMLELLGLLPWSDEDKEMTNYVMTLFSNFAKNGYVEHIFKDTFFKNRTNYYCVMYVNVAEKSLNY